MNVSKFQLVQEEVRKQDQVTINRQNTLRDLNLTLSIYTLNEMI
jgi:hypothetical protein